MLKSQPLVPQNLPLFGHRVLNKVIKLKWGHQGAPYSNMSSVLTRKGNLDVYAQRKIWRYRERVVCKPRREASEETNPGNTLTSDFQPSELQENTFLLCESLLLCYDSPHRLRLWPWRKSEICLGRERRHMGSTLLCLLLLNIFLLFALYFPWLSLWFYS